MFFQSLTIGALGAILAATAASAQPRGGAVNAMDANADGKVTAAEMDAHQEKLMREADADGDGALSRDELRAYRARKRAERQAKNNPDLNDDGLVDRNEFRVAADKRFDRLDRNGDGVLSEDEKPDRRKAGRRGRGRE